MKFKKDKSKKRYGVDTLHTNPSKPFLMLAILQGFEEGKITGPLIEPTQYLEQTFWEYSNCLDIGRKREMWLPFFHMHGEHSWNLQRRDGNVPINDGQPKSTRRLRERYIGAQISDEYWSLYSNESKRKQLILDILDHNFHPDTHQSIKDMERISILSNRYAEDILGMKLISSETKEKAVRDSGFRKAIQKAYDHTCVFTGIRIQTPSYHTIIDAAHIIPWSDTQDDSLENGIALSKNCHWAFDKGMLSVDENGCILVSSRIRDKRMNAPEFEILEGREILPPKGDYSAPSYAALKHHREKIFID